ncbi:GumC family protein [Rhizobium sp. RU20A]|uniref:GumC family protein n=1 Tax=Rhizobium sp. RU20A TaxID=1907412 RepID=UPI00165FCF97|nr:GumC family protein [Rhizobium sp. RU20A]
MTASHVGEEAPSVASAAPLADKPLVDLRVVIGSVWTLRYAIVATTVLGAVAGVMLALATPSKYVATSKLYVDPREMRLTDSDLSKQSLATEGILALVDSQLEVLRSRGVLEKVVTDLGLERDPEFGAASGGFLSRLTGQPAAGSGGSTVAARSLDALAEAIAVGRDPKTFIITLDVTSRDPAKSALIANRLVDAFLAEEQSAQSAFYRRTTEALDSRLEELRKELDVAENAVEDFKANNDIVGANGQLISEKELSSLNDQVSATRSRIAEAKAKVDVASRVSPNAVIGGNFPEEVNSLTMTELRKQYATAKTELGALEANLGPRHPQRLAAAQSVETARNEIANELNRIAANARAELARAEQAERDLVNQLNTQKTRQITASSSYVELRDLERTANATRAIYESFLKRARETSEEQKLSDRNIRVISKAEPPLQPVGPSRKLIAIAGVIGGLFLGLGLAVLFGIVTSLRPLFDPTSTGRNLRRTDRGDGGTPDRADRQPPRAQHRQPPSRPAYATADDALRAAPEADAYRGSPVQDHARRQASQQDGRTARSPERAAERYVGYDEGPMLSPRGHGRPAATAGASQDAVEALLTARRMMEDERRRDEAPPASRTSPRPAQPIDTVEDDLRALRHRVEAYVRRQAGRGR